METVDPRLWGPCEYCGSVQLPDKAWRCPGCGAPFSVDGRLEARFRRLELPPPQKADVLTR